MKKTIFLRVIFAVALALSCGMRAKAQDDLLNKIQNGFTTGAADVVKVSFNRIDPLTGVLGARLDPDDENLIIKSGQRVRVSIESSFPSFVYIINIGPGGTRVIYPASLAGLILNKAHNRTTMDLEADQKPGRDALLVITSRTRIPKFDDVIQSKTSYKETFASLETIQGLAPAPTADTVQNPGPKPKKHKWLKFLTGALPVVARIFGFPVPYLGKDFNVVQNSVTNESFAYIADPSGKLPQANQRGVIAIVFDHQ